MTQMVVRLQACPLKGGQVHSLARISSWSFSKREKSQAIKIRSPERRSIGLRYWNNLQYLHPIHAKTLIIMPCRSLFIYCLRDIRQLISSTVPSLLQIAIEWMETIRCSTTPRRNNGRRPGVQANFTKWVGGGSTRKVLDLLKEDVVLIFVSGSHACRGCIWWLSLLI